MVAQFNSTNKNSSPFAGKTVQTRTSDIAGVDQETVRATNKQPKTVLQTVEWLLKDLGISPVPNCPSKAVDFGEQPKAPNYVSFDGCVVPVKWQKWQDRRPPKELLDKWFSRKPLKGSTQKIIDLTGVGAIAGLNDKGHYISFIDIDAKHFDDQEQCDQVVEEWRSKYPILHECPRFRSPGGGYRFLIALSKKDEIFGKVAAFNLDPNQGQSIGEILHNNGGHSLFPPSVREDGKQYYWEHWVSYPPVIDSYESIGLFPTLKAKDKKAAAPTTPTAFTTSTTSATSTKKPDSYDAKFEQLIADINSNLSLEQAFNWDGHNFIADGDKLKGRCPWHDSTSGTSFYCERDNKGNLVYRCAGCDDGGNVFGYRYSLKYGQIGLQPKGKDFIDVLKELGAEIGADTSFLDAPKKQKKSKTETIKFKGLDENPTVAPLQVAEAFLFGDGRMFEEDFGINQSPKNIIAFDDNFYKWEGNYYELIPMKTVRKVAASYWNNVAVEDDEGNIKYPYVADIWVSRLINWVIDRKSIDQRQLPKGINFKNGVVTIDWSGHIPVPNFEKHDPQKHYFFKEPKVKYDPKADPTDCNRMLTCLDDDQRDIVLKVMAASLDLKEVRKRIGARKIKVLFFIGEGNNGKDTLRNALTTILGDEFHTGVSLQSFINHDSGASRFGIAPLIRSKVNWPSETVKNTTSVDDSASLKSFATGDPLYSEYKGKDAISYNPEGICIFNTNHHPNLTGTTQASKDRFIPIQFRKIYQTGLDYDPSIHLLGDIRFKDDPEFLINNVCPAFFNKLLASLQDLVLNGIDYSCTFETLHKIQIEGNHLFEFVEDVKLVAGVGEIKLEDIYLRLEEFYTEQGILTVDDFKNRRWADPVKPSDPYIKGINNLFPKLKKLFPKIEKQTLTDKTTKRKTTFIRGVVWGDRNHSTLEVASQNLQLKRNEYEPNTDSLRTHYDNLEPLQDKESKPSKPSNPTFSKFLKKIEKSDFDNIQINSIEPFAVNSNNISVEGEKSGFTGFTGSEIAPSKGSEKPLIHDVGLPDGKTGFPVDDQSSNCDWGIDDIINNIINKLPDRDSRPTYQQKQQQEQQEIAAAVAEIKRLLAIDATNQAFALLYKHGLKVQKPIEKYLEESNKSQTWEDYLNWELFV